MVEFLSKFQGRGIKIDRVNSIRVAKSTIFFNILHAMRSELRIKYDVRIITLDNHNKHDLNHITALNCTAAYC